MSITTGRYCTACGAVCGPTDKFCAECGQPLAPPAPEAAADEGHGGRSEGAAPVAGERRRRDWRTALLVVATVLVLGLGDWAAQNVEMRRLLTAIEASEDAMVTYKGQVRSAANTFEVLDLPDQDEAALQAYINSAESAASDATAKLIATDAQISSVTVAPWHRSLVRAKAAYLDHSGAWRDHLSAVSHDGIKSADRAPEINGTFAVVVETLPGALPAVPWPGEAERVKDIIDD